VSGADETFLNGVKVCLLRVLCLVPSASHSLPSKS
jgi:hypothetical protein